MNKHEFYMDELIDKLAQLSAQADTLDEEINDALYAEIKETANALNARAQKLQYFLQDQFI